MVELRANAPRRTGQPCEPAIETAWCGSVAHAGSPIVTTTDGRSDPIVWVVGAEGDNRLHAFRVDSGEPLATPPETMRGLHHFQTLIAADDTISVGLYAPSPDAPKFPCACVPHRGFDF